MSGSERMRRERRTGHARDFAALGLSARALAAVAELGYRTPTPVQRKAIPAIRRGRDVLAAAQTGTGKTAAFVLPVLDGMRGTRKGAGPRMLVVTPTRELAQQIARVCEVVGAHTGHTCATVVGGVGYDPQRRALHEGCDVLVATPGRLLDLAGEGSCSLAGVEALVLDEADRMLDMGFLPSMRKIWGMTPSTRQTLLFSATLSPDVLAHTTSLVHDPVRVEVAALGTPAHTVKQYVLGVSPEAKKRVLVEVLRREGSQRVIAFVRGRHRADHLSRILSKKGFLCAAIHGNRTQGQRMRALERFAAGEVDVLVATDVLSRGIDVAQVAYVVNVDVPHEAQDYVHRIGRTGRAGKRGWSLTLCTAEEYADLRAIEHLMGAIIAPYPRAGGMDRGEAPFEPDPTRSPHDRPSSRKTRRRRRARRSEKGGSPESHGDKRE